MQSKRVIVIGAGIGGLCSAIDLARNGIDVTVVERAATVGGKVRTISVGGALVDSGPTVFTMKWVFDSLFADAGQTFIDHVALEPLHILARHAWGRHQRLDLYADQTHTVEAIREFSGMEEADRYLAFCEHSKRTYAALKDTFLTATQPNPLSLSWRIGLHRPMELLALKPFTTLWRSLSRQFHDPRLRQLFGRYATYVGSSPFSAPATLSLIAHVEQEGVWAITNGMTQLPQALRGLAETLGVTFQCGADVKKITATGGKATGVVLKSEEILVADAIVFNGDVSALGAGLLGEDVQRSAHRRPPAQRSLSAITWSVKTVTTGFPLHRHNVFFSDAYQKEFDDIFTRHHPPQAPTIYVCAQDRSEDARPHPGDSERLLMLINAPALPASGDTTSLNRNALNTYQSHVLNALKDYGLFLEPDSLVAVPTGPSDFNGLFPGTGGALYGAASHGWASSFRRATSTTKLSGLYLAGGSTHPGAGVPMAALSGRLAARRLISDLGLTPT
jgi:1-hydroxycarotenoid 3,4-desaturase